MLEAASLHGPDEARRRHDEILEDELGGVHALVAELADRLHHAEPTGRGIRALLDDEAGHPAVARSRRRIGEREQGERVALAAVGDEHLRPGQHEVVAPAARDGADGLDVGARLGLGEAEAAAGLAAGEARQEAVALRLGAVLEHDEGRHGVAVDHAGQRHEAPAQLLDDPRVRRHVEPESAPGPRHQRAEQPELAQARHEVVGVAVGVFELRRDRHDLHVHEPSYGTDDGRERDVGRDHVARSLQ